MLCLVNIIALVASHTFALPIDSPRILTLPSNENGEVILNTSAAVQLDPNCYGKLDPVFFPVVPTPSFNHATCQREWLRFQDTLIPAPILAGPASFWYTSNQVAPAGMEPPFLQLPVYHKSTSCSFAILSTKLLSEFAQQQNIPWRYNDWGNRLPPRTTVEVEQASRFDVWFTFHAALAECVKEQGFGAHRTFLQGTFSLRLLCRFIVSANVSSVG